MRHRFHDPAEGHAQNDGGKQEQKQIPQRPEDDRGGQKCRTGQPLGERQPSASLSASVWSEFWFWE